MVRITVDLDGVSVEIEEDDADSAFAEYQQLMKNFSRKEQ